LLLNKRFIDLSFENRIQAELAFNNLKGFIIGNNQCIRHIGFGFEKCILAKEMEEASKLSIDQSIQSRPSNSILPKSLPNNSTSIFPLNSPTETYDLYISNLHPCIIREDLLELSTFRIQNLFFVEKNKIRYLKFC
jgi:hypothetical protein